MGRKEKLLICSLFVSIYLLTPAKCGLVNGAGARRDGKDTAFVARDFTRERRSTKDCSGLQKDFDEMKIKCRDSYKVAEDNIVGLKIQLEDLFKQVSSSKSPGHCKDVLNILQKFINLQEIEALTKTEREGVKIEGLERRKMEAERDLAEMKKAFSGSVEMFHHAVLKRSADTSKNDKTISTTLNEFKKYLEDRLKKPWEKGGIADQVLQIVKLQIEAMDLQTRLASKYKTQAQIEVTTSRLEYKNGLLSDLKEEREEMIENTKNIDAQIKTVDKDILELNSELSALNQILDQLNEQSKEFDRKRTEVMNKIDKLKGNDELISSILILQFEFMEALITIRGQIEADRIKMIDVQSKLEKQEERALYFQADNENLRGKLIAQKEQCEDVMDLYQKAEAELEVQVNQITDSSSKKAIQIILLGFELDQITNEMKTSSSNDVLKRRLDEKINELKAKKKELEQIDSGKILQAISKMEDIWKLQNEDPENLKQISNLQKDLLNFIKELDEKCPSKPMLQMLALQLDVSWIKGILQTVTAQAQNEKAELQKELDKKERLLAEKRKELATATTDINKLKKDVAQLEKEISTLKTQISTDKGNINEKIKDLEEKLKQSNQELNDAYQSLEEKNATISQQVSKINSLIEEMIKLKKQAQEKESQLSARIAGLERKLIKTEEENGKIRDENEKLKKNCMGTAECTDIQKKYEEMQAEYNKTISELNGDILQKAFLIKSLIEEVEYLDKQIAQGFPELRGELEEKQMQLEKAKQELKAEGSTSAKTLEVLQLLSKIWKLQENPTEENTKKIQKLEAKLNGLLSELQNSEKGLGLALNIMSLKESMSRLKQGQTQMQEKYTREINDLKKEIDDKEKEILVLKANCGETAQQKEMIKQLEKEVEENKQKMKKLQRESNDKIASLEKQIETKDQELAKTEDKLADTNAQNAALIKQLNSLNDNIEEIKAEKNNALKKAEEEITGLKDKLQKKEDVLAIKEQLLKEKDNHINVLKDQSNSLKDELQRVKEKSKELETNLKIKDRQLANTEEKLKNTDAENQRLVRKQKQLEDDLQKVTEEKNTLQDNSQKEINDLKKTVETQNQDLAKKNKDLQEKNKEVDKLQKENNDIKAELDKETKGLIDENKNLKEKLEEVEQKVEELENLKKTVETQNQDLAKKNKDLQEKNKEVDKLQKEKDNIKAELDIEKNKHNGLIDENKNLKEKLEEVEQKVEELDNLKTTVETQKEDLAKKNKDIQEKNKEVDKLQKEKNDIKAELDKEKNKHNSLIKENNNLKEKLEEVEQKAKELEKQNEHPQKEWPMFDANTAHRRVILSQDGKEARTSLLAQSVPESAERYDTAIAVLAKPAYDSGKHYWEIGVTGRNCFVVGAVRESAQRKGILSYSPSEGYWVILKKRDGKVLAIDERLVQLNVPESSSIIGVQLDFLKNEVTFYNAEYKNIIYKFTGNKLQGKIYPYAETCSDSSNNDPPLILKQPQSIEWVSQ